MAGAVVEHCLLNPGSRIVCIRECRNLAQSAKLLIENKIQEFGVGPQFRILYDWRDNPWFPSVLEEERTSRSE
jgi:hypothetical protein